jgi:hypothetical protein
LPATKRDVPYQSLLKMFVVEREADDFGVQPSGGLDTDRQLEPCAPNE